MAEFSESELRDILDRLGKIRGRHTELVSFYVPAGFNLYKAMDQIKMEQSTAQNIKSKAVRKNVMAALDKITQHLRFYKTTPARGVALFCGNVSEKEGNAQLELWVIEPPEDLNQKLYWCGQTFILDPLLELVREKEIYGLIVLDKSEGSIGLLKGKRIEMLKNLESIVPGKSKAGGWSANRFSRIREGLLEDFMKKIGEVSSAQLLGIKDLKGVIVGGPGPIKEQFLEGGYLNYQIKNKVLGVVNTSYTGMPGLEEAVNRGEELISEAAVVREKKVLEGFFDELAKSDGLGVYGLPNTLEALKAGNMNMLIIHESFKWEKVMYKCQCGWEGEKLLEKGKLRDHYCHKCDNKLQVVGEEDFLPEIEELAKNMGTKIETVSRGIPKSEQFMELGGIGGLLRYKQR